MKMSKVLGGAALASLFAALPAFAQDAAAPAAEAVAEVVETAAAVVDKGDVAWMLVSTMVVIVMTIPGLALFYGGLVRAKNVLSVLTQVFLGFSMIAILWVAYGYSLAFAGPTEGGLSAFVGDFSKFFLAGVTPASSSSSRCTATALRPDSSSFWPTARCAAPSWRSSSVTFSACSRRAVSSGSSTARRAASTSATPRSGS